MLLSRIKNNSLIRSYALGNFFIPTRALVKKKPEKKKVGENVNAPVRMVPHLPPEMIRDTVRFLENKNSQRSLLELIYSPLPESSKDSTQDRLEYQTKLENFLYTKEKYLLPFRLQEEAAKKCMWNALHQLPEDLYDEAVASNSEDPPEELLYNKRFRNQLFDGKELTEKEMIKLQVFQNLMHIRFPHKEAKKLKPERFWIRESQAVSRQKQAALRTLKGKKKSK